MVQVTCAASKIRRQETENPLPVQPVESLTETPEKRKYLALSIFSGILFGLFWFPAMFAGILLSLIILLLVFDSLNFFPQLTQLDFEFLWLPLILGAIFSTIIGITSGRRFYANSNNVGSARRAVSSMLFGPAIGLAGLLCFPVVCYAGYFVASASTSNSGFSPVFPLVLEPEIQILAEVFICIPSVSILLAYLAAGLSSWIAYRRLDNQSKPVDQN